MRHDWSRNDQTRSGANRRLGPGPEANPIAQVAVVLYGGTMKLVILDCDGVLIDSEVISAQMLIEELAHLGVQIDMAFVAQHFLGRSYPTVMQTIRQDFGLNLSPDFEAQYRNRLLQAFDERLTIMPGVNEFLASLALPVAVATSSSPRRVEMSLRRVGLWDRLGPVTFTASLVPRGKPEPDLFLHVALAMHVAPTDCIVIEDSLPGLRAGLAAGMQVWHFVGGSHMQPLPPELPDDTRPHRRFAQFAEFFQIAPELQRKR
jgi:HAD superfamily hydrolase (TIGR01509 family)